MTYSAGHPIRLIGGRLALDFTNTTDWLDDGGVTQEKFVSRDDVAVWLKAVGLPEAEIPEDIAEVLAFRLRLRNIIQGECQAEVLLEQIQSVATETEIRHQSLLDLVAISALSLLADPRETERIKTCPGPDCGWMFLDETKSSRRKWCMMETCGNRAKAARHYERSQSGQRESKKT